MYGTEMSEAADALGGIRSPPFESGTSTPLILIHVNAFVGEALVLFT
jgi:hypothetical protein